MKDLSIEGIYHFIDLYKMTNSIDIEIFDEIDSTNNYLKQPHSIKDKAIKIIIAKKQTAGRGQYNKQWISERDAGLWMSVAIDVKKKYNPSALSLVVGSVLAKELNQLGANQIGLKWPNDLIYENRKLGGILIESMQQEDDLLRIIIGIGLNIRLPTSMQKMLYPNKNPIGLDSIIKKAVSINMLTANLIKSLYNAVGLYEEKGLSVFLEEWTKYDLLLGNEVVIENSQKNIQGTASGISSEGALLVSNDEGMHHIISGSVRYLNREMSI